MVGVYHRKSNRDLAEEARAGASPASFYDTPAYPGSNYSQRAGPSSSKMNPSSSTPGLPNLRLSGFDVEKMMAGVGGVPMTSSPSQEMDERDWSSQAGEYVNVKGNHRNSPRPYQPPPASASTRAPTYPGSSPAATPPNHSSNSLSSAPQQSSYSRRSPAATASSGGYFRPGDAVNGSDSGRAYMAKSRSQDPYGSPVDMPRPPYGMSSPPASPHRSRPSPQPRAPSHRSSADYYASPPSVHPPPRTEGVTQWIARANETDDQRRAREWEEARERQHAADRKERYEVKAKQAEEESSRRRAEFEEMERQEAIAARKRAEDIARKRQEEEEDRKRAIAAARVERERQEREAEAERLREQERRWQEKQARKKEEEARRREMERQRQEDEERRRREDAARWAEEVARRRQMEERQRLERAAEARRQFEVAEAARIKAEEEAARRRAEAEKARIQAEKEAEQARIRAQQEAERRRIAAEQARIKAEKDAEQARIRAAKEAEEARLRAIEEARLAKIKAIEDAEKARLKAIEDAEKARLKAIEDEKRRIEKAKQDYIRAIADGHANIEREDKENVDRGRHEAAMAQQHYERARQDYERALQDYQRHMAWLETQQQDRGHGSHEYYSSDSGVSLPSTGGHGEHQQKAMGTGGSPDHGVIGQNRMPQIFTREGQPFGPQNGHAAPNGQGPQAGFQNGDHTRNNGPAGAMSGLPHPAPVEAANGAPMVRFQQPGENQGIQAPVPPPAPITRRKRNHLRFISALTVGARSAPQSAAAKSGRDFAPAVRVPWDAGIIGENALPDYNPATLANVAFSVALADVSDPTKPRLSEGWQSHGYGDPDLITSHYKVVEIQDTRLVRKRFFRDPETGEKRIRDYDAIFDALADPSEFEEVWEPFTREELVFDLFGPLFSKTTPDVLERIVSHLDCADVKALRQTCSEVRTALDTDASREVILRRFLYPVGYQTWQDIKTTHTRTSSDVSAASSASSAPPPKLPALPERDPLPITFQDVEGFFLATEVFPEYALVGADWLSLPHEMDARVPRLARATTRAYSRVLTRLRLQPSYKVPSPPPSQPPASSAGSIHSVSGASSPTAGKAPTGLASSPLMSMNMFSPTLSANGRISPAASLSTQQQPVGLPGPAIASPWKPGRVAVYRVWVPCRDRVWLSDEEIAKCERELFLASVWPLLRRGDIIRNTAMVDEGNVGKLIFDGRFLRDLSFAFDPIGHIPSWLNLLLYPPAYYHNVIKSSTASPILYLDILPWREQIISSLRLVQDQVETTAPNGLRYRIAKWLYRTTANVKASQIISEEGFQCVDEGWEGKLFFETEGTSEHAKDLVLRCAGPLATPQAKAKILAAVLGQGADAGGPAKTRDSALALLRNPAVKDREGRTVQVQYPFAVMRDRSKPGLIWLRPVQERERIA
ncbi:hypothetical protein BCV69DRAFT_281480 [Microstroma glucosiphilum]|uniref:Uncharacterized protein n=1 Tax=Pseudomicrostroma glucosiphilum TaxID=1684307 RepID=A0A316UC94_9BASI|nr:hypothetical protein BCV69DRAFT_281480 [Pseudomicrostroma glucosiphilum]PWN22488.1 hypothetical protein BCV69DRAFT_281480 [Pseudomicrostroma glucosiphilum]